ncbi:MAG: aldo/keto reductase [Clostridiales bacterium]|nr:aldo/keto reductase [Clostridiales bacterium]
MYEPDPARYDSMICRRCGNSGIQLPALSLGLWHSFGNITPLGTQQAILRTAFDLGICHFDLADNYGPPYGEAERNFGILMDRDWKTHRDELFLSTKAGYDMWPGPYGDKGSRKHLIAGLDASLKRMRVDYVDVFYHHRPDPDTPLEETMSALSDIVKRGKALYIGLSNYGAGELERALYLLREMGTPCLVTQPRYSLLERKRLEGDLEEVILREKIGCVVYSPLARGVLTGKYLTGIPEDSRAAKDPRYLKPESITAAERRKVAVLSSIAAERGEKLHHMALAWVLKNPAVTSALIGVSRPEQLVDNLQALASPSFSEAELTAIDAALAE